MTIQGYVKGALMLITKLRDKLRNIEIHPVPLKIGLSLAAVIFVLDQVTKWLVLYALDLPYRSVIELTSFLNFRMAWNAGVSFGLFQANGLAGRIGLILFALCVVGFLLSWLNHSTNRVSTSAIGLVIGGAIGNIIDRTIYGAVVDFVDFHFFGYHFYTFNVADTAISVGVAMLIFDAVFGPDQQKSAQEAKMKQKTSELSEKMD